MQNFHRVAITGIGVVTSLGIDKDEFFNNLLLGKSGIDLISSFDTRDFAVRIGGEILDFDPSLYLPKKEIQRMDRFCQFGVIASMFAYNDAKIKLTDKEKEDFGIIIGSGIGGVSTFEKEYRLLIERGPSKIGPFFITKMIGNMASGQAAIFLGAKGYTSDPVTACASGTNAIGDAFKLIKYGNEKFMIAGGAEAAVTPLALSGFAAMKALSRRNDTPKRASRPFDRDRDGFVLGEGAGVLFLEEYEHALSRGAHIYAEIVGFGASCDAYHITLPDPEAKGASKCMLKAIKEANIDPTDIDYINAHGTSTSANDVTETKAIKKVFGKHSYKLVINSTKSMIGHLLGAAGGVETAVTVLSIEKGFVHPTINLDNPDPECDLDYVQGGPRKINIEYALSNSFGFGGHNFSILLKKV